MPFWNRDVSDSEENKRYMAIVRMIIAEAIHKKKQDRTALEDMLINVFVEQASEIVDEYIKSLYGNTM